MRGMSVEDLSLHALIHRDGRFFRAPRSAECGPGWMELRPRNGALALAHDGFVYFSGDPFPPGGRGTYRVGEQADGQVKLYPGLVLDQHRLRIGYRFLGTYKQD
jgi:hypothetical protein